MIIFHSWIKTWLSNHFKTSCTICVDFFFIFVLLINNVCIKASANVTEYEHEKKKKKEEEKQTNLEITRGLYNHAPNYYLNLLSS